MSQERLASFVTVSPSNRPHGVPVFFTYEDGRVYVQTDRKSVKVRNLLKNHNVAVAVCRGEEAVIISGEGRIIDDDEVFFKRTKDHVRKYKLRIDSEGGDSLGTPLFDKRIRCVIEVTPGRTIFW
jgi:nitroimidazol reductase NimA-like FMN-containing flavoprotein (pyridoxamine 5'-phosphate oxidase superfamily)